jgi:hypothetical protein
MRTTSCHELRDLAANTCCYQCAVGSSKTSGSGMKAFAHIRGAPYSAVGLQTACLDETSFCLRLWHLVCVSVRHVVGVLAGRNIAGLIWFFTFLPRHVQKQWGWNVTATLIILTRSSFCLGDTVKCKQKTHEHKFQTNDTVRVCEASAGLAHVTNVGTILSWAPKNTNVETMLNMICLGKMPLVVWHGFGTSIAAGW